MNLFGKQKLKPARMQLGRLYHGRLIYQSSDEWGSLEVVEDGKERSLHFGGIEKQSACLMAEPQRLLLEYTKAMMLPLLFLNPPKRILVMGLGGGSVVKFLQSAHPEARIEVVELRSKVVEIAQRYFGVKANENIKFWIGDVRDFLRLKQQEPYDLILVDLFDSQGMSFAARQIGFFQGLKALLSKEGVMSMNLWDEPINLFDHLCQQASRTFEGQSFLLPVLGRTNVILTCHNSPFPNEGEAYWIGRAKIIDQEYKLGLPSLVSRLYYQNSI